MHRTQGYSPIDTAKLCFDENLRQYVNAKTNPEAYNILALKSKFAKR